MAAYHSALTRGALHAVAVVAVAVAERASAVLRVVAAVVDA